MNDTFKVFKRRMITHKTRIPHWEVAKVEKDSFVLYNNVMDFQLSYVYQPEWTEKISTHLQEEVCVMIGQNGESRKYYCISKEDKGKSLIETMISPKQNEPWLVSTARTDANRRKQMIATIHQTPYASFERLFVSSVLHQPQYRLQAATGSIQLLNRTISDYL